MKFFIKVSSLLVMTVSLHLAAATSNERTPSATERHQGDGPYKRLILRGVTYVSGEGAPPVGPVDIVIEQDRIAEIVTVGNPGVPIPTANRPKAAQGDKEMDLTGMYVLPGFIDMHGHIGGSANGIPADYVFKLWLAHGITTVREPGSLMAWPGPCAMSKRPMTTLSSPPASCLMSALARVLASQFLAQSKRATGLKM